MRGRVMVAGVGLLALCAAAAPAQQPVGNGIVVGAPKQYPYRYLEEQLADLDAQLAELRLISPASVAAQIGKIQGSQRRRVDTAVSAEQTTLPGVVTTEEETADGARTTSTETTREAVTPTAPTVTGTPSDLPFSDYGVSAQDLLTEQMNLQYQAFNLRMLLKRAVSDRYYDDGTRRGARLQALLGFRITIDPRREHRSSAAVVEIEVTPSDPAKAKPSLVALMPEEKTYNAVALSEKSNAFGGAAISGVFSLGFSGKWQNETFFLYRDADTFSFERPPDAARPRTLQFGWQFRPVLNKKSVEPGTRYLFAVLALDGLDESSAAAGLDISARSYWVGYRPKQRLAAGGPRLLEALYDESIEVVSSTDLQEALAPRIREARVASVGGGKLLVTIEGSNLFRGSTVHLGDRALTAGNSALTHRSDERLEFVAPEREVLTNEVRVTGGEFGFSTLVREHLATGDTGLRIYAFDLGNERRGDYQTLNVTLRSPPSAGGCPCVAPGLHGRAVFLTVADRVFEIPAGDWRPVTVSGVPMLEAAVEIPFRLLLADREISAQIPFLGPGYQSRARFHPPIGATRVMLLESGDPTTWGIVGHGFSQLPAGAASLWAGREYLLGDGHLSVASDTLLELQAPSSALAGQKKVILSWPGRFEPVTLPAPSVPAPRPKPTVTTTPSVAKNASTGVEFRGTALKRIGKVLFEGDQLDFQAVSDGKLVVYVTRAVTKQAGKVSLLGYYDEKAFVALDLVVQ